MEKQYNLTTKDLMKKYDKTIITIYNWIEKGLPHIKEKNGLREIYKFNPQEVEKWIQEN